MNAPNSQRHSDSSRQKDDLPIQTNEDVNSEANISNHLSVSDILRTLLQESQHDYNSDSGSDLYTPDSTDSPTTHAEEFFIGRDYGNEEKNTSMNYEQSEDNEEPDPLPHSSPSPFPSTHPSSLPPYLFLLNSASAALERRASSQAHIPPSPDSDMHSNYSDEDSDAETDLASYNGHDEGGEEDVGIDENYSDPFEGLVMEDWERGVRHQLSVVELVRRFRELVGERWGDVWKGEVNPFGWGMDGDEECLGGYMRFPYEGFEGVGDGSGEGRGLLV